MWIGCPKRKDVPAQPIAGNTAGPHYLHKKPERDETSVRYNVINGATGSNADVTPHEEDRTGHAVADEKTKGLSKAMIVGC